MPLYIFYGQDSFSLREALRELRASLDEDGSLMANTLVLEGRQVQPQELVSACSALPFLGAHRVVIVEGLLGRFQGEGRGRRAALGPWESFVQYAGQLPPHAHLVLVEEGTVERGNPLLQALAPHAQVREFRPLWPEEVTRWVVQRCQRMGLRLSPQAVALLADLLGNDLWALNSELEKLATYAGGEAVGEREVQLLVAPARELSVFALIDAAAEGEGEAALRLSRQLSAQGEAPLHLLALLARHYRRLLLARYLLERGASERELSQATGLPERPLRRLLRQARRYSLETLRAAYRRLLEADVAIKRGQVAEEVALEELVYDLARLPAGPAGQRRPGRGRAGG